MNGVARISSISIVFFSLLAFYLIPNLGTSAQGPTPSLSPISPPPYNFCNKHGGINCLVINGDASVSCNDGVIDHESVILTVSECTKPIDDEVHRQSNQMADAFCYPPSTMGCFERQSYQNLSKIISDAGLSNSELAKDELDQCDQQLATYQSKYIDYQKCLSANNIKPSIFTENTLVQPLLKNAFCPIFFGNNSHYDSSSNLCICDSGYFMSRGSDLTSISCKSPQLLCQDKHGLNTAYKNGSCITKSAPVPTVSLKPSPARSPLATFIASTPRINVAVSPKISGTQVITPRINPPNQPSPEPQSSPNIVIKIFSGLWSVFQKILKL